MPGRARLSECSRESWIKQAIIYSEADWRGGLDKHAFAENIALSVAIYEILPRLIHLPRRASSRPVMNLRM
jgi:hypothetical protein